MRLLGSVVLLTGALSVGAYAYLPVISFNHHNLSKLVRIQTPGSGGGADGAVSDRVAPSSHAVANRTFSPSTRLFAEALDARRMQALAEDAKAGGAAAWRSVAVANGDAATRTPTGEYVASVELARELQRELKRVGCYEGDADGDWKAASRRAMGAFLSKVNATLPVDRPDYILLTLLQGHADRACDLTCPAGQGVSSDGRCVPNVVIAQSPSDARTTAVAEAKPSDRTSQVVAAAPWTAKVSTAGTPRAPRERRQIAEAPAVVQSPSRPMPAPSMVVQKSPAVAEAAIAGRAAEPARDAAGTPTSAVASIVAREPLPGRMSVGAVLPGVEHRPANSVAETPAQVTHPRARAAIEAHEPERGERARPRAPSFSVRKEPVYGRQPRYARSNDAPMVRTHQGKVRRGSPQHNLMQSLGGVF